MQKHLNRKLYDLGINACVIQGESVNGINVCSVECNKNMQYLELVVNALQHL
jgi:hypothetical protein